MKIKNYYTIISLCILFTFNTAFSLTPIQNENSKIESTSDSNWLKNHHHVKKAVRDGIEVSLEGGTEIIGPGVKINIKITWEWVDCCKYIKDPYYWCDAALQDKRC